MFEVVMLVCFGLAWPFSIYKSIKSKSNKGKSALFILAVLLGYICGIFYKLQSQFTFSFILYIINACLVATDLLLYWRNYANST